MYQHLRPRCSAGRSTPNLPAFNVGLHTTPAVTAAKTVSIVLQRLLAADPSGSVRFTVRPASVQLGV